MAETARLLENHDLITRVIAALDARDTYTASHSFRVAELTQQLCGFLSLSEQENILFHIAAHLHDIGKNLVSSMLEGCGFEVINLGVDVSDEKFVEAAKEHKANIVCMSALLTTTMVYMKEVIKAFEKAGIRNDVKIMIGGAPLSEKFAEEIGADGYSDNANAAVTLARKLLNK